MLSPAYVKSIEDWLKWYNEHHNQLKSGPLDRRVEFLEKGIRGCFIILAGLTYEVERVDIGAQAKERKLILPVSFR